MIKKVLFLISIGLCALVALYCVVNIWEINREHQNAQKAFDELEVRFAMQDNIPKQESDKALDMQVDLGTVADTMEPDRQQLLMQIKQEYPDTVAWMQIPDTDLNYPIMQTVDTPNYYLHRDMEGNYSAYGVPYLQENCVLTESDNLIVYGHCMKNGDMFGTLSDYQRKEYWEKHPIITLVTEEETAEYEIFAVFKTTASADASDMVLYHTFVKAKETMEYDAFVQMVKAQSFYDTQITPGYGEQLLTLSTCEYTLEDGRLVVVARKKIG